MGERQVKKIRKQGVSESVKKPKDKKKILFNAVAVVVVIAFAGLAGYAISNEVRKDAEVTDSSNVTENTETDTAADTSTLSGYAESMGMTFEEMAEKYALDTQKFTADMPTEEATGLFTLENMAKMNEMDIEDFKREHGLASDVKTDVPNSELSTAVMMKVNGYPYTLEDLKEYGLSDDITEDTKWADAMDAVNEAANAKYTAEAETQKDSGTAAEGTEEAADGGAE